MTQKDAVALPALPEPVLLHDKWGRQLNIYTADQMRQLQRDTVEACAKAIEAFSAEHCDATGECDIQGADCDFVAAWLDAARIIRELK